MVTKIVELRCNSSSYDSGRLTSKRTCSTMTLPIQENSPSSLGSLGAPLALRRTPRLDTGTPHDKRKHIALYSTNTFDNYTRLFSFRDDAAGVYQNSIPS